jgi:hypothetical protein
VHQIDFSAVSIMATICPNDQSLSVMPAAIAALMYSRLPDGYSFLRSEKSEAFRLPLAKKVSTPFNHAPRQIDGA